jgi:Uma2 family endonuclease
MNIAFDKGTTVDEFLVWAEAQPKEAGKFELLDGVVIVQRSQRWAHSRIKHRIAVLLGEAIAIAGVPCFAAAEGPTVRIRERKAFEPDALVAPLPEPALDSLEIPNPIVVVEVLSPSTARIDTTVKLQGYFEVASVRHYLIVDPEGSVIVHHRRADGDAVETTVVTGGELTLEPPGLTLSLAMLFGA